MGFQDQSQSPCYPQAGGWVDVVTNDKCTMVMLFCSIVGAVITYDIITGWSPIQLYDQFVTSVIVSHFQNQCL